jgi:hypothetical protein
MYKKHRITIGSEKNRQGYLDQFPYCEICGSRYGVAVHHHYKQGKRYLDQNYTIDLPDCYSTLCNACHSIVHTDEEQYSRRIWGQAHNGRMCWKDFDYWHTSKEGRNFYEIIECELEEEHGCIERVIEEGE